MKQIQAGSPVACIKVRKSSAPPEGDSTMLTYGSSASR